MRHQLKNRLLRFDYTFENQQSAGLKSLQYKYASHLASFEPGAISQLACRCGWMQENCARGQDLLL